MPPRSTTHTNACAVSSQVSTSTDDNRKGHMHAQSGERGLDNDIRGPQIALRPRLRRADWNAGSRLRLAFWPCPSSSRARSPSLSCSASLSTLGHLLSRVIVHLLDAASQHFSITLITSPSISHCLSCIAHPLHRLSSPLPCAACSPAFRPTLSTHQLITTPLLPRSCPSLNFDGQSFSCS